MRQNLAFGEPLESVPLISTCFKFMSITKKYQDCKAVQELCSVPIERKLPSVRARGKKRPLQMKADQDSAGAGPHSVSCKLQVMKTTTKIVSF